MTNPFDYFHFTREKIVCRTSQKELMNAFKSEEGLTIHLIPDVEKGLMLFETRGRGAVI